VRAGLRIRVQSHGSFPLSDRPDERRKKERGVGVAVPVAAVVLIAAVWASLEVSRADPADAPRPSAPGVSNPTTLPGFRADAWFLPDDDMLGFVEVPGGPFLMGSDPTVDSMAYDIERWSSTEPQKVVDVPTFYIGKYEVTVAQFLTFVRATSYRTVDAALREPPDHPINGVTWPGALAYARWLQGQLETSPATPARIAKLLEQGWKVGLPSEPEWEKAARGTDGRIYPWGNQPRHDRANFGGTRPTAVGSFECPECPYGLSDMSGNVWEWTRSPYRPYPFDPSNDHTDLDSDALWVMRGGSYADSERNVRAAVRGGADPGVRQPTIGFRLVISKF
jgi:formylglycine-generating enzyme required for sulfatase activity